MLTSLSCTLVASSFFQVKRQLQRQLSTSVHSVDWTKESGWRTAAISWNRGLILENFSVQTQNSWFNLESIARHPPLSPIIKICQEPMICTALATRTHPMRPSPIPQSIFTLKHFTQHVLAYLTTYTLFEGIEINFFFQGLAFARILLPCILVWSHPSLSLHQF